MHSTQSLQRAGSRQCCRPQRRLRQLQLHIRCANGGLSSPGGHPATSPQGWAVMRQELLEAGVKVLSPQEMIFRIKEQRAIVIDVRPEHDYDEGHVPGALNVPFYQPISGWSPFKIARRVGYAAFGVLNGTEVNPSFEADVRQLVAASPDQEVILYCAQGGVLEPNENHAKGWQTRSLIAAYELKQVGLSNALSVMRGGFSEWCAGGRDIEVFELVEAEAAEDDKQLHTQQQQ